MHAQGDLKKEIKKLQRFRDQVKTWAGSNDIKDKSPLLEARRRIEEKMESFKVVEKETKTKAFSKEGLMAARDRKDPKEKAKDEAREWLNASVDELNSQIEAFESEIESLLTTGKRGKSKSVAPPRLGHLEESMSRHHQHIQRLELCLRLVDNEALSPADTEDLKELVEDYLERNQDDFEEFGDVEDMYADLNLDELEDIKAREVSHQGLSVMEKAIGAKEPKGGDDGDGKDSGSGASSESTKKKTPEKAIPAPMGKTGVLGGGAGLPAPLGLKNVGGGDGSGGGATSGGKVLPGPKGREGTLGGNGGSWGAPGGAGGLQQQQSWSFPPNAGGASGEPPVYNQPQGSSKFPLPMQAQQRLAQQQQTPGSPLQSSPGGKGLPAPLQFPKATGAALNAGGDKKTTSGAAAEKEEEDAFAFDLPGGLADLADPGAGGEGSGKGFGFGGALGGDSPGVLLGGILHHDPAVNLRLLESSYRNLPQPGDGQWTRRRRERPPAPIPPSYPTTLPPVLENPALFERLDADALFFTFYYQQGTAQQYLAARELKRANWRFHKKHATWFARQEEPKVSTEEYEQGSYIYFDFAMTNADGSGAPSGWCQRSKADFKFEYSQLESETH